MKSKRIILISIGIILLLIGSIFILKILNKNKSNKFNSENINSELEKYRSENIPEDCRLPEYESDINWWKQHLRHHKQTWYCLEYYGTSIEKLNERNNN